MGIEISGFENWQECDQEIRNIAQEYLHEALPESSRMFKEQPGVIHIVASDKSRGCVLITPDFKGNSFVTALVDKKIEYQGRKADLVSEHINYKDRKAAFTWGAVA